MRLGQKIAVPGQPSRIPRVALGTLALLAAVVAAVAGWIPLPLVAAYAIASLLAWLMYRSDKVAAQCERQRTPEATLHLVGLLGGWPGAVIAQQLFRHKTIKQPFQAVFWCTVVLNLAAVAWLLRSGFIEGFLATFAN